MVDKKVIIAGYIGLNLIPNLALLQKDQAEPILQPGKMVQTGGVTLSPGGVVPNVGRYLHKFSLPVSLIGKIGDDWLGRGLLEILSEESPQLVQDLMVAPGMPTAYTILFNPSNTDRTGFYSPGASDTFYASDLPRAILATGDLFHFGTPHRMRSIYRAEGAELVSILLRARREGLTTSLDFSLPVPASPAATAHWHLLLINSLPLVDLFTARVEDLVFLLKPETTDPNFKHDRAAFLDTVTPDLLHDLSEMVLKYGVKTVLIKLGHWGFYLRTAISERWQKGGRGLTEVTSTWHNRELWAPAYEGFVQGAIGADDAAIAGFLSALLKGSDPQSALRLASAVGAGHAEGSGGMAHRTSWEAILGRLNQGWAQMPLVLDATGWQKDARDGVWSSE